ncbi:hypothetical protein [Halolamina salina]|uniref:Uncharacterized protein n=2 Tax=Halolamina salina TaxID=1220023 RepID=A0ABD6B1L5_9EURY
MAVLVVAATAGVATAAASPDAPCQGTSGTEARLFLDTGEPIEGDQAYYPGTTVTMYVCQDGDKQQYPAAWGFDASAVDGISIESEREYSIVFTLGGTVESVTPTAGVENRPDITGPTIRVQTGYRADSSIADRTIRFPSGDASTEFRRAEDDWQASIDRVENASVALTNVSADATNSSAVRSALATLNDSDLSATTTALQRSVIPAARSGDGAAVATVVAESNDTTAAVRADARESLQSYLETVEQRRSAAVLRVRLFVGGGLVGGLLVGAVGGYALSRRTLSKIERDRGVSTATQYSPKQVALPLILGVLALVAGVAVGALQWPTLFEVIL